MTDCVVVLITAPSVEQAESIGRALVESRLAACANIVPGLKSIFHWQGQVCTEDEVLMLVKSRSEQFPDLVRKVKDHHSYEVPEIIALPILTGDDAYLDWLKEETRPAQASL